MANPRVDNKALLSKASSFLSVDKKMIIFCFPSKEDGEKLLAWIKQKLNVIDPSVQNARVAFRDNIQTSTPYSFRLTLEQWKNLRLEFRKETLQQLPKNDFLIKSIRADKGSFFRSYVEMVTPPNIKYPLRKGPKKEFTVTGIDVFRRVQIENDIDNVPLKKPHYTPAEKADFSKSQSASLGMPDHFSAVFGQNTDRGDVLIGVFLERKDFLLSDRNYIYDGGTVNRPYDFTSLAAAKAYFKKNKGTILFSAAEEDLFKKTIKDPKNKEKHNEIMARQRWNTDGTSKIFIASDTLESRLQAQEYARLLKQRLLKKDNSYRVPIIFYCPKQPELHFKNYTDTEQELDRLEASSIYSDKQSREDKYKNKRYQFLLALSSSQIEMALQEEYEGKPFVWKLLSEGYVHILESLADRLGRPLEKLITFDKKPLHKTVVTWAWYNLNRKNYEKIADDFFNHQGGIDVDTVDKNGNTLLILAVQSDEKKIIPKLRTMPPIQINNKT